MTPTLFGRIQTRIFVLLVVGGIWTLLVVPFLPVRGPELVITRFDLADVLDLYGAAYRILLAVTILGCLWELLYHLLQQFRWEKDWPTFFGFITIVNEGLLVWALGRLGLFGNLPEFIIDNEPAAFWILFSSTWIVTFLFVNGPIRVLSPRYRFRGGRLI
jgi:hypothetical protein